MLDVLEICVMLGGPSGEREVSLQSGAAVSKALRGLGHRVSEIDPVDGDFQLPQNTDVVFLALHGTYGEDGTVQAKLDALGVLKKADQPASPRGDASSARARAEI